MDGRQETSPQNGLKGGRPKSLSTIRTQMARDYISKRLEEDLPGIYTALHTKANEGDVAAAKELFDRGWGKSVQAVVTEDNEGERQSLSTIINYLIPNGNQHTANAEAVPSVAVSN